MMVRTKVLRLWNNPWGKEYEIDNSNRHRSCRSVRIEQTHIRIPHLLSESKSFLKSLFVSSLLHHYEFGDELQNYNLFFGDDEDDEPQCNEVE